MIKYGKIQESVIKALSANYNEWLSMEELVNETDAFDQSIRRGLKILIGDGIVKASNGKTKPLHGQLPKMYKLYKLV